MLQRRLMVWGSICKNLISWIIDDAHMSLDLIGINSDVLLKGLHGLLRFGQPGYISPGINSSSPLSPII